MRYLIIFVIFGSLFMFACSEDAEEMEKPGDPVIDTSLEKAEAAMARVTERRIEAQQKAKETGDYSTLFKISDQILEEELGFDTVFFYDEIRVTYEVARRELHTDGKLDIDDSDRYLNFLTTYFKKIAWEMETTGGEFLFEFLSAYNEVITEYVRLTFRFPTLSKERLLEELKKSALKQKIDIQYPEGF